ncbi:hypothetical protein QT381_13020 [Galbitalea sp. SE-J8]|uniref:arsenate reductase/protein-tyrosine-phosphatase family protein n=1 Tax=Galbitalea sp. SE-J8 TaxID=3054952 RepID=UPI00259C94DD|nr:hypothetical protein [Galbitalea sp. SE-J8]MDM4763929.1 hypothetical protein [Galbitalea sp. SE-J8]
MPFRILTVCTGNICRSPQAEQLLRAGFTAAHGTDATWPLPEVSSAGVYALVDEPMPEQAAALSREFGGDPDVHVARQLTKEMVEQSDLIIALAREHRAAIAKLSPRASRYTFTLRELARVLGPASESPLPLVEEPASAVPLPLVEEPASAVPLPVVEEPASAVPLPLVEEPASEASRRLETTTPAPGDFPGWLAYAAQHRGYHPGTLDEDDVIDPYRRSDETYRRSAEQIVPAVSAIVTRITSTL